MTETHIERIIEAEAARRRIAAKALDNRDGLARRCAAYRRRHTLAHIAAAVLTVAGLTLATAEATAQPPCAGLAGDMTLEAVTTTVDTILQQP